MNRQQQRLVMLFGLLLISAALLGRANSLEAQELSAQSAGEIRDADRGLVLTLGDVVFDAGKASLQPSAVTAIDSSGRPPTPLAHSAAPNTARKTTAASAAGLWMTPIRSRTA